MEENSNVKKEIAYENAEFKPWGIDLKQYTMFMHLALLTGLVIPFGGYILPLVMWLTNKEGDAIIDEHGKNIANFMISMVIYGFVGFMLSIVFIGIFLLMALGIIAIVLPIIGAVRASEGKVYKYPLTIQFLK
ncbi:DUF4870 domain-containing protein [Aureivirga sp. CE67]|uniref:DUF4870 domain-containing protein n=1 Tax=Aureivirga sp. CE67 TaxID=1788983 RepID=UPI0018CA5B56|nr:DUF4870 domain-containing protein [Aureivirga sp. CE67]